MEINLPISAVLGLMLLILSCNSKKGQPSGNDIQALHLKQGELISCGPPDKEFGQVNFDISCSPGLRKEFDLAVSLLHSFEYDEAEKVFSRIIDRQPDCAMAYWGVAMSSFHQLWEPPSKADLEKGAKAIEIALSIPQKTKPESEYINALALFYKDWKQVGHRTRSLNYQQAMARIHRDNPGSREAAVFYALALVANADPSDKTFTNQKAAGKILTALYPGEPDHPGVIHYIIHAYDYPELAEMALPAARKYAATAPSSAHAQHMPAHIFTRLGLWEECIRSSIASTAAAKCYGENAGIKGHWDEELHGMDYLVYAYLQKRENSPAKSQCDYLNNIQDVYPVNFKTAYAFAAIPSRYVLENRLWKEAAALKIHPAGFPWQKFPWQSAVFHFTRILGDVHTGHIDTAESELKILKAIYDTLTNQGDQYKATQVLIQVKTGEAWIALKEGRKQEAVRLMTQAADLEDNTEKHPVTPGAVLPARELLGDLYLELDQPDKALQAYESDLKIHPGRFNGMNGAVQARALLNDRVKTAK
ncbi:tetratricopeptide repeat protein [Flavihumibacter petaseus]|uniref:Tetratricopeptide repeat protein n=1 Tax=Flavihumibacter petaseus NBRC 106054 TaxID=1220578 RepID=A0A0E9MV62_9BACT|nr:hypothetical protein [Flavihumibacter petaseus]GAO41459.1 hypothetical protein FPE01S_01_04720 [Flavihumibacter petaseus NBRC 106054]